MECLSPLVPWLIVEPLLNYYILPIKKLMPLKGLLWR